MEEGGLVEDWLPSRCEARLDDVVEGRLNVCVAPFVRVRDLKGYELVADSIGLTLPRLGRLPRL